MKSLTKRWIKELGRKNCGGVTDFDLEDVSEFVQQTVILKGQVFNSYINCLNALPNDLNRWKKSRLGIG